jgi:hypothetical protein
MIFVQSAATLWRTDLRCARVPLAVRERVQLAKAKRSGSRRRPTRLISCAGYAREQARSSPPDRVFCPDPRIRRYSTHRLFHRRAAQSECCLQASAASRPDGWVRCRVRPRCRRHGAGACPAVRPCDRALRELALRVDPGTPSASPPAPHFPSPLPIFRRRSPPSVAAPHLPSPLATFRRRSHFPSPARSRSRWLASGPDSHSHMVGSSPQALGGSRVAAIGSREGQAFEWRVMGMLFVSAVCRARSALVQGIDPTASDRVYVVCAHYDDRASDVTPCRIRRFHTSPVSRSPA